MKTETMKLPAYWASALINNDYSGLQDQDASEADRCRAKVAKLCEAGYEIVDCAEEAHFTWHYRLYDPDADCTGGEVLEYVALRCR